MGPFRNLPKSLAKISVFRVYTKYFALFSAKVINNFINITIHCFITLNYTGCFAKSYQQFQTG